MTRPLTLSLLRDAAAATVVAVFMFPLFWWALTSIKPVSAVLTRHAIVWFDFTPVWENYAVTFLGSGPGFTWGFTAALSTADIVPSFIFILLTQRHLVRGLTMGAQKG